ncbi:hypothetical protein [Clostridium sp. DL1XJH146]
MDNIKLFDAEYKFIEDYLRNQYFVPEQDISSQSDAKLKTLMN